jgi:hypothetical protein
MPPGGLTAVMPPEGSLSDNMPPKWSHSSMPPGGLTAVMPPKGGSYRHHATGGLTVACHQVVLQQSCRPQKVFTDVMPQKWSYSGMPPGGLTAVMPPERGLTDTMTRK